MSATLASLSHPQDNATIMDPESSGRKLLVAIDTLYGFNWASSVLPIIGWVKLRILLLQLRILNLARESYLEIRAHLAKSSILPNSATHREWRPWSGLISKYNLSEKGPPPPSGLGGSSIKITRSPHMESNGPLVPPMGGNLRIGRVATGSISFVGRCEMFLGTPRARRPLAEGRPSQKGHRQTPSATPGTMHRRNDHIQ